MKKIMLFIMLILNFCVYGQDGLSLAGQALQKKIQALEVQIQQAKTQRLNLEGKKQLANNYKDLAGYIVEARTMGYSCELEAYLTSIYSNLKGALENSDFLAKNFSELDTYKKISDQSLAFSILSYTSNKEVLMSEFAEKIATIFLNEKFTLYKVQPGILRLGELEINKGAVIETTNTFDDDGNFLQKRSDLKSVSIGVFIKNNTEKYIHIYINNVGSYRLLVKRNNVVVPFTQKSTVKPTDSIEILKLDDHQNVIEDRSEALYLFPDECSA